MKIPCLSTLLFMRSVPVTLPDAATFQPTFFAAIFFSQIVRSKVCAADCADRHRFPMLGCLALCSPGFTMPDYDCFRTTFRAAVPSTPMRGNKRLFAQSAKTGSLFRCFSWLFWQNVGAAVGISCPVFAIADTKPQPVGFLHNPVDVIHGTAPHQTHRPQSEFSGADPED